MRRLLAGLISAACSVGFSAYAESEPVLLVEASQCASAPATRPQTGFLVEGLDGIVTALHGVVGCSHITARHSDGSIRAMVGLRIQKIDRERDVALLSRENADFSQNRLRVSPVSPASLTQASVLGHPSSVPGIHRMELEIARPALRSLGNLVPPELFPVLQRRSSPSITINVISVNDDLQPGHSGAPLLDSDGRVVGVANGGLAGGTLGIGWAIPFQEIVWRSPNEGELRELGRESPQLIFSMAKPESDSPAPIKVRPSPSPSPPPREQTVDYLGFRFTLKGCFRDGPSVRCEVLVTNREEDRDLHLQAGRLIDEGGNALGAVTVGFGPEVGYLQGRSRLASGVPVRVQIKFENLGYDVDRLALVELELAPLGRYEGRLRGVYGAPRVQFRSVSIHQE